MREDKFLMRFVIITGTVVSSLLSLIIIITVAYFKIWQPEFPIPEVLNNWGGIILGFYFGSFLGLLKDWLRIAQPEKGGTTPPTAT